MTDALERLIEAVAAGEVSMNQCAAAFPSESAYGVCTWHHAWAAHNQSFDATLSLLSALLPDHDWGRAPGGQMWVRTRGGPFVWSGDGYPPARGLLLAILRAKLAENHPRQETSD